MIILKRITDNEIVSQWSAMPVGRVVIPETNIRVHSPTLGMEVSGHVFEEVVSDTEEINLNDVKKSISHRIDADAEDIRLKYITPGDGMSMTYREKFEQAELVNEIGETAANALSSEEMIAAYPTLSASVGLEASTLWECAQLVRSKYAQFAQISHVIEKTRLSGKASVSAATTFSEAKAAYEEIEWTV